MLRGILLTTGDYLLLFSGRYHLKKENNTENMNKHDKISAFRVKIDTLWNYDIYSNSTKPNQFCLEIILCRMRGSFDYLMYPYYPAYTG